MLLSTDQQVHVHVGTAQIKNSQYEKLLGVTIDTDAKLNLETHIQNICGKASVKLITLTRIAPFVNIEESSCNECIFNAQFSYYPLTRIFHSRNLNNKINRMHEKWLGIVYSDSTSLYEELLETDNSASVHSGKFYIRIRKSNNKVDSIETRL